ncbi:MAG: hypothetical protein LV479_00660 [Methylacidiphilales bacterium]|nr:hypothetical protein [Candidatus Methylacidiphilales bacterium]
MPPQSIAILFLERDRPEAYVVSELTRYWREDGLSVQFLFGTKNHVPADLLFLHVNLSVVPENYLDFARRYPCCVNLVVRDIRKHSFSSLLLTPDSNYPGPVIVKTDLNCGGDPERRLHPHLFTRFAHRWQYRFRPGRGDALYSTYSSLREVPPACWRDPGLVIEKFVPERIGDDYAVRTYHFLGNQEAFFLLKGREPIVKGETVTETVAFKPDPRLSDIRRRLGFDYGKFDYVLLDGQPVLLDLNKTVGLLPNYQRDPHVEKARRLRAKGIYNLLDRCEGRRDNC